MKTKINYIIIALLSGLFCISCEQEENGPFSTNSIAPGTVSEISATAEPGGASISFKLPSDEDILSIRAEYTLPNGETAVRRVSKFNSIINIDGLLDSLKEHQVLLYSEDFSGNVSDPASVNVSIKKAPIYLTAESVGMIPDFGGAFVSWGNSVDQPVTVRLFTRDHLGFLFPVVTRTDRIIDFSKTVNGFEPVEREFMAVVSDRWDNTADTVKISLTPLPEFLVPKEGFADARLPGDIDDDSRQVANGLMLTRMWDGSTLVDGQARQWITDDFSCGTGGGSCRVDDPVDEYDPALGNPESHMVTIDLGKSVKLSRFRYWGDTPYAFGYIKRFDLWGIDVTDEELQALKDGDPGSLVEQGWVKLLDDAEVIQPSGQGAGNNSQEDLDVAYAGHEFKFALDAPKVRLVRFSMKENWIGGTSIVFTGSEFSFWGDFEQ